MISPDFEPPTSPVLALLFKLALLVGCAVIALVMIGGPFLAIAYFSSHGASISPYLRGVAGMWSTLVFLVFALAFYKLWSL